VDDDDVETLLEDIEKREGKLTDWERQFVDSVSVQLGRGHFLSDRQVAIVNQIWERVT
jgi:hypothetical protein